MIPLFLREGRMKPDNWYVVFKGYVVLTEEDRSDVAKREQLRREIFDHLDALEREGHHWTQAGRQLWFEHFDDAAAFYLRFKQGG